jgi:ElaB/YqjD/DUF883 family membrane-anchored ribosome-binding protein
VDGTPDAGAGDARGEQRPDDHPDPAAEADDVQALRADIEQTRAEMGETIDAIKEKLSPEHLVEQVKGTVHDAAAERVSHAKEVVKETAAGAVASAREVAERAREAAGHALDAAKETVSGAVASARQTVGGTVGSAREKVASVTETAAGAVGSAREAVSDTLSTAGDKARSARTAAVGAVRENPLPFALAGAGLGAGIFFLSRRRNKTGALPTPRDTTQVSPIYPIEPPLTPVEEAAAERVAATAAAEIDGTADDGSIHEGGSAAASRATVAAIAVLVSGIAAFLVLRETRRP